MTTDNDNEIAWTITVCETQTGARFARLHPSDRWLNKYQLSRLVATLTTIANIASGKTKQEGEER